MLQQIFLNGILSFFSAFLLDAPSRPTFRSGLTQPSQMGNFKHQSLRANDRDKERDRDRDGEKERERDIRDKEGQERLRHVRLSIPPTLTDAYRSPSSQISMTVIDLLNPSQMLEIRKGTLLLI